MLAFHFLDPSLPLVRKRQRPQPTPGRLQFLSKIVKENNFKSDLIILSTILVDLMSMKASFITIATSSNYELQYSGKKPPIVRKL